MQTILKKNISILGLFLCLTVSTAQDLKPFDFTNTWLEKICAVAPTQTSVPFEKKRNILIFSLHTGYEHWTLPHTESLIKCIAEKSNGFTVATSKDINEFQKENLTKYDAIILNNTCSNYDTRNIFYDKLKEDTSLTEIEVKAMAAAFEKALLDYVAQGNGLMVLHGGIVMQNNSKAFGEMVGGTFDYHPKQQKVEVKLVDPEHPLVQAFENEGFEHVDEPYFFSNAYFNYNFRPLLYMEADKLEGKKEAVKDNIKYISWIKKYGNGRIFYSSPSHNPQSYDNPKLIKFLLDGLCYATGDLVCDDSPILIDK